MDKNSTTHNTNFQKSFFCDTKLHWVWCQWCMYIVGIECTWSWSGVYIVRTGVYIVGLECIWWGVRCIWWGARCIRADNLFSPPPPPPRLPGPDPHLNPLSLIFCSWSLPQVVPYHLWVSLLSVVVFFTCRAPLKFPQHYFIFCT